MRCGLLLFTSIASAWCCLAAESGALPNILLVTADDLGIQLGCYGEQRVATPNLDRLAAEGVCFRNAYVAQSSCSPSRASILTGRWPHQNGMVGLAHLGFKMRPDQPSLTKLLRDAGYYTGIVGKLHVEPASQFPFDWMPHPEGTAVIPTRDMQWAAAKGREFFAAANKAGKPFFFYVNYFDPHDPLDHRTDQIKGLPADVLTSAEIRAPMPFGGRTPESNRARTAHYLNAVARIDAGIGLLLKELNAAGCASNTLVVFVGDNGVALPRGKATSYEYGVRVPFLLRWPGVAEAGIVRDELVMLPDLMPTFLKAAGSPVPEGLAGEGLQALLGRRPSVWRRYLFTEMNFHRPVDFVPQRTVRDSRHKLVLNLQPLSGEQTTELYDLTTDPWESEDLADSPALKSTREELEAALQVWREQTRDPLLDPAHLQGWRQAQDDWGKLPKQKRGIHTVTIIPDSDADRLW